MPLEVRRLPVIAAPSREVDRRVRAIVPDPRILALFSSEGDQPRSILAVLDTRELSAAPLPVDLEVLIDPIDAEIEQGTVIEMATYDAWDERGGETNVAHTVERLTSTRT